MTIDQFLHELPSKQKVRQTDRQTLNCQMATLLAMVPPVKEGLSYKKENHYENRRLCSKIIDEQTLNRYIYRRIS